MGSATAILKDLEERGILKARAGRPARRAQLVAWEKGWPLAAVLVPCLLRPACTTGASKHSLLSRGHLPAQSNCTSCCLQELLYSQLCEGDACCAASASGSGGKGLAAMRALKLASLGAKLTFWHKQQARQRRIDSGCPAEQLDALEKDLEGGCSLSP